VSGKSLIHQFLIFDIKIPSRLRVARASTYGRGLSGLSLFFCGGSLLRRQFLTAEHSIGIYSAVFTSFAILLSQTFVQGLCKVIHFRRLFESHLNFFCKVGRPARVVEEKLDALQQGKAALSESLSMHARSALLPHLFVLLVEFCRCCWQHY
jgi:hypothetical protein